MRRGTALLCSALLAGSGGAASAWEPATRTALVDAAIKMMPASLSLVLEKDRREVVRGMIEPLAREDDPSHRAPGRGGTLDASIDAAASAVVEGVRGRAPFHEVSRRFGVLAHFVADAGFPPVGSGPESAARFRHFSRFCESRHGRFPWVFYGHADPDLARGDFRGFAGRILARSRDEDRNLARAYAAAGTPPSPEAFDDRSIPFAVGSLAYSRTMTDIVRAWLAAWEKAGGDLGWTPYLRSVPRSGGAPAVFGPPPPEGEPAPGSR